MSELFIKGPSIKNVRVKGRGIKVNKEDDGPKIELFQPFLTKEIYVAPKYFC